MQESQRRILIGLLGSHAQIWTNHLGHRGGILWLTHLGHVLRWMVVRSALFKGKKMLFFQAKQQSFSSSVSLSLSLSLSLSPLPGTSLRFLISGRTLDECSCLSSPRCVAPWLLWRSSWEVRRPRSLVVGFLRPQALPPTPRKRQMTWTIPASMPPTPWGLHPGLRLPPRLRWPQMKKACCWPVEQWTLTPPRRPVPLQSLPRMVSVASQCLYTVMMYFNSACHFFLFSRIHTLIWLFSCPPASWLDEESPPPPSPSPDVQSLTHASLLT